MEHSKTSLTDSKKPSPAPSVEIRLHHASRWLTFSPLMTRPSTSPACCSQKAQRREGACSCSVIVRPDASPRSCAGPARFLVSGARAYEAPASVPGLGRDPGRHEAGGLARRRGADKAKPPPGGGEQENHRRPRPPRMWR